jgi:cytidylate kinase
VITIDGPSGSGKGVITQKLAAHLGFHILDSGALYRLVGLAARNHGIQLDEEDALAEQARSLDVRFEPTGQAEEPLKVLLEGEDVTRLLRTDQSGVDASKVAPLVGVREGLGHLQRSFRRAPGLIADGRDMATVVFTDALVKFYLTASAQARAERRDNQLKDKDIGVSLHDLFQSIQDRDERDMNREVAPLKPAEDAIIIDSTDMNIDEVFEQVLSEVREKLA